MWVLVVKSYLKTPCMDKTKMSNWDQGGRPIDALNPKLNGCSLILDEIRFGREGVEAYLVEKLFF
jgi:hypothetical protein